MNPRHTLDPITTATVMRTDCTLPTPLPPLSKLIESDKAFYAYLVDNEAEFDLTVGKSADNFYTRVSRYNEAWFKTNTLALIRLGSSTGSIRYSLEQASMETKTLWLDLRSASPQYGTCDMAYHHILVEIAKPTGTFETLEVRWH